MNLGDQFFSIAVFEYSVIWGNRKAPSVCAPRRSRCSGPPPSSLQYQRANTRMLVSQSAPADRSSSGAASTRVGSAMMAGSRGSALGPGMGVFTRRGLELFPRPGEGFLQRFVASHEAGLDLLP